MQLKEYVSALMPALSASAIMAVVVFLTHSMLPERSHPLPSLLLLIAIGTVSYAGALLTFHRQRVTHMLRVVRSIRRRQLSEM
jgi:hypothetical protein